MAIRQVLLEFARAEDSEDPHAFRFTPQRYLLRTPGGGIESVVFPWSEAILADITAVATSGAASEARARLGSVMHGLLASTGWQEHEATIPGALRAGDQVIVTIQSAAAELYALPWELMTLRASGEHLGALPGLLIRYAWPDTQSTPPAKRPRPEGGRILVAWSAAGGEVPAAEHVAAIAGACEAGVVAFDPGRDVIANASLARVVAALERATQEGAPIAALHLLCHGGALGGGYGLVLAAGTDGGAPEVVDAARLRQALAPHAGTLRLCVIMACDGGNPGALGSRLGSVAQALHRGGIEAVVASRYPLSIPGSITATQVFYGRLLVDLDPLERALPAARTALLTDLRRADWAGLQLYARPIDGDDHRPIVFRPYRGLLTFMPEHARFYFGREAEIDELCADLEALVASGRPRLLIVAAASGTGKSSLVLAGAAARLGAATGPLVRMRPGADPDAALAAAMAAGVGERITLVVDQFEELFTHAESPAVREAFARRLWALASGAVPKVSIVVTLRVDFVGRCGELLLDPASGLRLDRVAYDEAHRVFLAHMGREQLRAAIERPAAMVGLSLEPGLVNRMLDDLGGELGALPLLEDTLDLLWQRRDGRVLTQAAYEALGGVSGALRGRADALVDAFEPRECVVARRLLKLVTTHSEVVWDMRRRLPLAALRPGAPADAARFDAIVDRFVGVRLLVRDHERGETTLEVAHEALLRMWPRLRAWIAEEQQKLGQLAALAGWVKQWREYRALLVGDQLGFAAQVAKSYPDDIDADARALIDESAALERRRARRRRLTLIASAGAAVVFALLAAWGFASQREANERRAAAEASDQKAQAEARRARDSVRVVAAQQSPPQQAVALLREVEAADPSAVPGWTQRALDTLRDPTPAFVFEGHYEAIGTLAFSADGRSLVSGGADETARIWDLEGGAAPRVLGGESSERGDITRALLSPRGDLLVTRDHLNHVVVWELASGSERRLFAESDDESLIEALGFTADGRSIWIARQSGQVTVQGASAGAAAQVRFTAGAPLVDAVPSGDGRRLVTATGGGRAQVWDLEGGALVATLGEADTVAIDGRGERVATVAVDLLEVATWNVAAPSRPTRLLKIERYPRRALLAGAHVAIVGSFGTVYTAPADGDDPPTELPESALDEVFAQSPDGVRVVVGHETRATVWRPGAPAPDAVLTSPSRLRVVAISQDSRWVAFAGDDLAIRVWPLVGSTATRRFAGSGIVGDVDVSRDGARIAAASDDKTARIYDVDGDAITVLRGHSAGVNTARFSVDGTKVVTASEDGTARVWAPGRSEPLAVLDAGRGKPLLGAAFFAGGEKVAAVERHGAIQVWPADGRGPPTFLEEEMMLNTLTISRDERWLAATVGSAVFLHDLTASGYPVRTLEQETFASALTMSADGQVLVVGDGGLARTWRGGESTAIPVSDSWVRAVAVSPDGARIATVSDDGSLRVLTAGRDGAILLEKSGAEHDVSFSPDGRRLLTYKEEAATVWDVDGIREPLILRHDVRVGAAIFHPDGARVVTGAADGVTRVWWIDPARLRDQLFATRTPCVAVAERVRLLAEDKADADAASARCEASRSAGK